MKKILLVTCSLLTIFFANHTRAQKLEWLNPLPTGNPPLSLFFTDENTGYVAGACGLILKTTDAGASWSTLNSGTYANLYAVIFPTHDVGYAVGEGTILKTIDAGATWESQQGVIYTAKAVYFTSVDVGYIVGEYHT